MTQKKSPASHTPRHTRRPRAPTIVQVPDIPGGSTIDARDMRLHLLEAAFQHTQEAIVITDAELDLPGPRIVYVNPGFEAMTGYRAAEVLGKTPRIFQGPETNRATLRHLRKQLAKGQSFSGETINYRKDGQPFTIEWSVNPVRDNQGRITHFVAVQRDITGRKFAEAEIHRWNAELEQRVQRRTAQLEAANEALRRENDERTRSEARHRALLNAVPDTLFQVNRAGVFLDYYPAHDFDPVIPPEQFLGKSVTEILSPELAQQAMIHLENALTNKTVVTFEYTMPQRFGEYLVAEGYITLQQLSVALAKQAQSRTRNKSISLGDILVKTDIVTQTVLQTAIERWQANGSVCFFEGRVVPSGKDEAFILVRNITERKQAEAELRYHANLLNNISDAVFSVDNTFTIQSWNTAARHIYGWSADEAIGKHLHDLGLTIFVTNRYEIMALDRLLENGEWRGETVQPCKDGAKIDVLVSVSPLRNSMGQPGGAVAVHRDITTWKQTENALRHSEAQYRLLAEHATDIIARHSPDGVVLYISPACETMLGYIPEELLGRNISSELAHPEDAPIIECCHADLFAGKPNCTVSYRIRHRDGTYVWHETTSQAIPDPETGQVQEIISISRDITERKRTENDLNATYKRLTILNTDLRRNRDLLHTLFDNLNDGVVLLDSNGSVLAINQALLALLPIDAQAMIECHWTVLCNHPSYPFPGQSILDTLNDSQERHTREGYTAPDGQHHVLNIHTIPIIAPDQNIDQAVVHIVDVTQRLELEAMAIQNERLSASGKLTATVAHEVNTPLQSIQHCLYLADTGDDAERTTYLTLAREEIGRVREIVNRLLDLYRPGQGDYSALDVNMLIDRVLLLTGSMLKKQRILVERNLSADLPTVWGRSSHLTQVLLSLTLNAVEAMPEGGLLSLQTKSTTDTEPAIMVIVTDSGSGIAPHVQARMFEPFFTTKPTGSGIGLAVCKHIIVDKYQGKITVNSEPGIGSTFTITIPTPKQLTDDS